MATNKTLTPTNVTIQIPDFTDRPDQRVTNNCIDKEADAINALNSNISNLFANHTYGTWTQTRNSNSDVWTAPSDCIAHIMFYIPITYGGGFTTISLIVGSTTYAYIQSPEYATGTPQETITLCAIARMTQGTKVRCNCSFSNNSNVGTCRYAIQY